MGLRDWDEEYGLASFAADYALKLASEATQRLVVVVEQKGRLEERFAMLQKRHDDMAGQCSATIAALVDERDRLVNELNAARAK
jgi:hypothetical protein